MSGRERIGIGGRFMQEYAGCGVATVYRVIKPKNRVVNASR